MNEPAERASASWAFPAGILQRIGVELEYMIVDRETLDVRPVADRLLRGASGDREWVPDHEPPDSGGIGWSNELVNHVIELKTVQPVAELGGLAARFQRQVSDIDERLADFGARLLPGGMHPWMDPHTETHLWPHEYSPVYERLDSIFSCRGHGWSNLQSTHINYSFGSDEEFGRLHAAVRAVLPLLPGLAASTPVRDGELTDLADARLAAYMENCRRIPSITGDVIPEPVYDRARYEVDVLDRIRRDLEPFDPEAILVPEWTNARGAIARFDRGSIEIRVLDVQECPAADLAIAELVRRTITALVDERWVPMEELRRLASDRLVRLFQRTVRDAESAEVSDPALSRVFGLPERPMSVGEVWGRLRAELLSDPGEHANAIAVLENEGTLSTRIRRRLRGGTPMRAVFEEMADCLAAGRLLT